MQQKLRALRRTFINTFLQLFVAPIVYVVVFRFLEPLIKCQCIVTNVVLYSSSGSRIAIAVLPPLTTLMSEVVTYHMHLGQKTENLGPGVISIVFWCWCPVMGGRPTTKIGIFCWSWLPDCRHVITFVRLQTRYYFCTGWPHDNNYKHCLWKPALSVFLRSPKFRRLRFAQR